MDGVIVVDKPTGYTSHDVVNRLRRIAGTRSIGHLGTLDPLATGVLPLVVGRATRLARFFTANDKRYEAVIRFGTTTDSYDRDGAVTSSTPEFHVAETQLEQALGKFRGPLLQTPPPVSAKKVGGVPAYKLARKNIAVELKAVEIHVYSLTLTSFDGICARIQLHCSAGTYVRSIAHELGQALGCGAIVDSLRRTSSGDFTEDQSFTIDALKELGEAQRLDEAVVPAVLLLPQFPAEHIDSATIGLIRQGKDFRLSPFRPNPGAPFVKAMSREGGLVAIGEARLPHLYHPILVF
ncbi:MAG: tRNA pseudouridine(55) synthase TruB [Acidobacteriota bacterium]|nr:tRNA pseudouridine(55) synthase TruB [Acidobacteriota bacterium]